MRRRFHQQYRKSSLDWKRSKRRTQTANNSSSPLLFECCSYFDSSLGPSSDSERTVRSGFSLEKSLCDENPVMTSIVFMPSCFPARMSHHESPTRGVFLASSPSFPSVLVTSLTR